MDEYDIELNLEELEDVNGGAGLSIANIPIKDLIELIKIYPGIDKLKEMVRNNYQEAINWAIENLPRYLYEKYSQYTLAELKDYVTRYVKAVITAMTKNT